MTDTKRILISSLILLTAVSCSRDQSRDYAVPASWKSDSSALPSPEENEHLGKNLDSMLKVGLDVVDGEDLEAPLTLSPENAWKLRGVKWTLGLSVDGVLGMLLSSGKVGFEIIYGLESAPQPPPPARDHVLATELTVAGAEAIEVPPQWEAAIRQAVAQNKIHDESRLRKGLHQALDRFREITRALSSVREDISDSFELHGIQMEISFDASGNLRAGFGLGGELGFRFNWVKETQEHPNPGPPATAFEKKIQTQLTGLIRSISQNMDELAKSDEAHAIDKQGFQLTKIKPFIGMSASGDVGLLSAHAEWEGMLRFHRKENPAKKLSALSSPLPISVFSENQVVQAPSRKFAHGLKKVMRIAQFFAQHAQKARSGKWKIKEFTPIFEVSREGSIGLVSVEGTAGLELTFEGKE